MSELELILGGTHYDSRIFVQARYGGQIDLPSVKEINDPDSGDSNYRSVHVTASSQSALSTAMATGEATLRGGDIGWNNAQPVEACRGIVTWPRGIGVASGLLGRSERPIGHVV